MTTPVSGKSIPLYLPIALLTFAILALELALIRWSSGQIRVFAYFNNLVLIGVFLGLGVGAALGRRGKDWIHWCLPVLLVLAVPLGLSEQFDLAHLPFPDQSISLWGGDIQQQSHYWLSLAIFLSLWCLVVAVFVTLGTRLGLLFAQAGERSVQAYIADLCGSLLGVLGFTLIVLFSAPPPLWLAVGTLPVLYFSRRIVSGVCLALVLTLGWYSIAGASYSPYNRIDLVSEQTIPVRTMRVNRDFHQRLYDFTDDFVSTIDPLQREKYQAVRDVYRLPFKLAENKRLTVIVGAGTGNDVQAALVEGFEQVLAVDIDPGIIAVGQDHHPERPYDDPRAKPIVEDARAFFSQYQGPPFDLVAYGMLDSHAMFSSMSTLRLDNYVYTVDGIQDAWSHVAADGLLAISFDVFAGQWIADRLYWTIQEATGKEPVTLYHSVRIGNTYVVAKNDRPLDSNLVSSYPRFVASADRSRIKVTTDDWPFLYSRPNVFPTLYVIVIGFVLVLTVLLVRLSFERRTLGSGFDPAMFFLGAAFLLLETRGITSLSLLFGSTWVVNSAVFSGVLVMALLGAVLVAGRAFRNPMPWYALIGLSLVGLWFFDLSALNAHSLLVRGLVGGIAIALPVLFAGVVFPILLAASKDPASALGSNLLGAVLGGCLEYLSMIHGLQALVALAGTCYLLSALFWLRGSVR